MIGTTGSRQPQPLMEDLQDIWGTSSTDVYAVRGAGTIFCTTDGVAWHHDHSPVSQTTSTAVWGTGSTNIYAVGGGAILGSDGTAWTSVAWDPGSISRPWRFFPQRTYGGAPAMRAAAAVASFGILSSILHYDGPQTWRVNNSPATACSRYAAAETRTYTPWAVMGRLLPLLTAAAE